MKKPDNFKNILKATSEVEEIILGSFNSEQPIQFGEVIRIRELLRGIEQEAKNGIYNKGRRLG